MGGVPIRKRGQTLWYSRYVCTLWFSPACLGDDVSGRAEVLVSSNRERHEENDQPHRVHRDGQREQALLIGRKYNNVKKEENFTVL